MSPPPRKVLLISGGAGGIGRAVAQRFGSKGAHIALADQNAHAMETVLGDLHQSRITARGWQLDVTDAEACRRVVDEAIHEFGRLDFLVHCAGITQVSPFANTHPDVFRRVMEVNFFGTLYLTQAALEPLLRSRGHIVALSSIAGFAPLAGRSGYCASKFALHGLMETLRSELAERGVSISLVCPSFVSTDFATKGLKADGSLIDFDRSTTGRPMSPQSVAIAIEGACLKRSRLVVLSPTGRLAYWVSRLSPKLYQRLMMRRFRVELDRDSQET